MATPKCRCCYSFPVAKRTKRTTCKTVFIKFLVHIFNITFFLLYVTYLLYNMFIIAIFCILLFQLKVSVKIGTANELSTTLCMNMYMYIERKKIRNSLQLIRNEFRLTLKLIKETEKEKADFNLRSTMTFSDMVYSRSLWSSHFFREMLGNNVLRTRAVAAQNS